MSERRVGRLACVVARALECYPGMTWEEALAINRAAGWSDGFRTHDADAMGAWPVGRVGEAMLRRAWELARGAGEGDARS